MALRCPRAWSSVAGASGSPAGERDDAAVDGVGIAELLAFQGELVDGGAELGEFPVLGGDGVLKPGYGGAEPFADRLGDVRGLASRAAASATLTRGKRVIGEPFHRTAC